MSTNTITYTRTVHGRIESEETSQRSFLALLALLFAGSAAGTVAWCTSMSNMGEMPMPGGWTMSMAWMRTAGQTWAGATASFVGMWVVMMVAMMLPSFSPVLWRYRQAVARSSLMRPNQLTLLVGLGYFVVWTAVGVAIFPLGVALATLEMQTPELARAVPLATGVVVLVAGALQFTDWKAHQLDCCREMRIRYTFFADAGSAWRDGLRQGLHCTYACAGLTATLLVIGVMNLRVMAAVTVAIAIERLAPEGQRYARGVGILLSAASLVMIGRAIGLG